MLGNQFSGVGDLGNFTVVKNIPGPPPSLGRWYVGRFPPSAETYQYVAILRTGSSGEKVNLKLTEVEVLAMTPQ